MDVFLRLVENERGRGVHWSRDQCWACKNARRCLSWLAVTSALSRRAKGDRFAKLARAAERDRVLVRAIEYCILEQQELTCCARH